MTHAEDFGRGFLGLLGNQQALGEAFHITSDELLSWNQIYQTIAAALESRLRLCTSIRFHCSVIPRYEGTLLGDKTWSVFFNTARSSHSSGFQATISFAEGTRGRRPGLLKGRAALIDEAMNEEIEHILEAYAQRSR